MDTRKLYRVDFKAGDEQYSDWLLDDRDLEDTAYWPAIERTLGRLPEFEDGRVRITNVDREDTT